MESNSFDGDFMVKFVWRLSGNLVHHACPLLKTQDQLYNFTYYGDNIICPVSGGKT